MAEIYGGSVPCGKCDSRLNLPGEGDAEIRCGCGRINRIFRFRPFRAPAPAASFTPGSGASCAYHAGNLAGASCGRCGSFICDLCATPIEGKTFCTSCFERLHAAGAFQSLKNQYPRPHAMAFACAWISGIPLAGIAFLALVAWQGTKAIRTRTEIREREPRRFYAYLAFAALLSIGGILAQIAFFMKSSAMKT